MPINLTTPQTLTSGTRLVVDQRRILEDEKIVQYHVSMRTAVAGTPPDGVVATRACEIRGPAPGDTLGRATVVARNGAPIAGASLDGLLVYNASVTVTEVQWVSALTAAKASQATFEAFLLTAGYVHSSLTGT